MPTRDRLLASLACALTLTLALMTPASASFRGDVVGLVNSARSTAGLSALAGHSGVDGVAQAWAEHLAESGELAHNPNFSSQIPSGWTGAAENVAYNSAPTPSAMHRQLMDSSSHRANILGEFTHIGVGYAVDDDGGGWLVEVFAHYPGSDDSSPPPPEPSADVSESATEDPTTSNAPTLPDGWLGLGTSGPEVLGLQQDLDELGYDVVPDGEFGTRTHERVEEFQAAAGLHADGLVGPATWAALADALEAQATPDPTTSESPSPESSSPTASASEAASEAAQSRTSERLADTTLTATARAAAPAGVPGWLLAALGMGALVLIGVLMLRRRAARMA